MLISLVCVQSHWLPCSQTHWSPTGREHSAHRHHWANSLTSSSFLGSEAFWDHQFKTAACPPLIPSFLISFTLFYFFLLDSTYYQSNCLLPVSSTEHKTRQRKNWFCSLTYLKVSTMPSINIWCWTNPFQRNHKYCLSCLPDYLFTVFPQESQRARASTMRQKPVCPV